MDSEELQTLCLNIAELKEHFLGVFPCDQVPQETRRYHTPKFCIVNLDPSYKDGSHWVTLIFRPQKRNIYFDSYGFSPPQNKQRILNALDKHYVWNKVQLQHPLSTACGQWCIFFCCAFFSGNSLSRIKKHFSKESDLLKNDFAINEFVNNILSFDKCYQVLDRKFLKKQFAVQMKENL